MSDGNAELIRGAYDAFLRGDIPGVMAVLSEDVEWSVPAPLPQAVQARGHEEVGGFFQRLVDVWEGFELSVDDFVADGDRVCVIGSARGRVGGVDTGYGFVHCWTVAGGRATRFDEYAAPGPELL